MQMIGYAHAAGNRNGVRPDLEMIADYFSIPHDRLSKIANLIESADRPEIVLLQNKNKDAQVSAAVLFSSAWSKAYSQGGTAYGRVWRYFHYQVMFSALAGLIEVGCNRLRMDCLMLVFLGARMHIYVSLKSPKTYVMR